MRSRKEIFQAIVERAYLVDPDGTDADLMQMGEQELASNLRHDHRMGRIAEHHAAMTGRRVVVERVDEKRGNIMAGGLMVSSTPKEARE